MSNGDADKGLPPSDAPRWPGGRLYFVPEFFTHSAPPRLVLEGPSNESDESDEEPEDHPDFLFSLPEYSDAFATVLFEGIENLAEGKSPVLRELVSNERTERVRTNRVTTPTGGSVDIEPRMTSLRYAYTLYDVTGFDLNALSKGSDTAAEALADSKLEHLLDTVGRIAEGFDKVGSASGQRFGWPVLLMGLEKLDIEFEADGKPILPKIVAEHDKRHFVEYPPLTAVDQPAFDRLIARKRKEFDARGSRR
jgi:hypothetical protein